ncbi:MAG TPA: monofunctional biosynthetic peptidoglycan transglycosylase, partial [Candidatus Acidoferrales bacterium]|nr:monofunctional biosynthetic peptidoglycan transglycosylase [Candidatus Acidoferrales bacterium]
RLRDWFLRVVVALFGLVIGYNGAIFWRVWQLREHNPENTAFMQQGLERLQERNPNARLQHRWVPYEKISVELKRAVIAAEDQKFLDHEGFDVEAIQEAYEKNERSGRIRRGASTISQQLAKNLFLSPRRSYLRKAHEGVITLMMEALLSKQRILEIYLNVVEWGNGIYGAEAAARYYYGTSAAALDAEQAARMAAMIPSPRYFSTHRDSPYLEQRTQMLLSQMGYVRVP